MSSLTFAVATDSKLLTSQKFYPSPGHLQHFELSPSSPSISENHVGGIIVVVVTVAQADMK